MGIQEVNIDNYQGSIVEIFQHLFGICTREKIWVAMVCWSLWNRRNSWVWDKIMGSEFGVYSAAMNLLNDWKRASVKKQSGRTDIHSCPRRWSLPSHGWLKVNRDAATFLGDGSVCVSSVIRNEAGEFVRARAKRIAVNVQPREAEVIGLKEALAWTRNLGIKKCIFETDSKLLAEACKGVQGRSYFHTIVLDCIQLFKHFDKVLVQFVHTSANEVAHTLARATHSTSGFQEWIDVALGRIYDVLINDLI